MNKTQEARTNRQAKKAPGINVSDNIDPAVQGRGAERLHDSARDRWGHSIYNVVEFPFDSGGQRTRRRADMITLNHTERVSNASARHATCVKTGDVEI